MPNCAITISKPQGSREGNYISLRLRDETSRLQFVEAEFSLSDFMDALTGMAEVAGEATYRGLEHVGKTPVREDRSILCPLKHVPSEQLSQWLEVHAQEDGWILNAYLGSRGSTEGTAQGTILKYSVTKYI